MEHQRSADPAVAEFMKLVGEKPLLTKSEEERLGVMMDRGRHAEKLLERHRSERGCNAAIFIIRRTFKMRRVAAAAAHVAGLTANPTMQELAQHQGFRRLVDRKIEESQLNSIAKMVTGDALDRISLELLPADEVENQADALPAKPRRRKELAALLTELSRDTLCLTDSILLALGEVRLDQLPRVLRDPAQRSFLKIFNKDIEGELQACIDAGHDAQNEMSECNMRLVVHTARNFIHNNTDLVDLSQEGAVGLIDAAKRFDHRRGYKFSTYATNWIRHRISKALVTLDRTIRIPHQKHKLAMDLYYARERLLQQMSVEPTTAHLADEMGLTVEQVEEIQRIDRQPESLDAIIWDDTSTTQLDRTGIDAPGTDELAMERLLKPDLEDALATLDEKERKVLIMRYGLTDDSPKTVTDISVAIHTNKERVREIERAALSKLRDNPAVIAKLSAYV